MDLSAPGEKGEEPDDEKNEEQNFRDADSRTGNSTKSKNRGDQRNDEEHQ